MISEGDLPYQHQYRQVVSKSKGGDLSERLAGAGCLQGFEGCV